MSDESETAAKVPYSPSENKRWEISKDEFSRERVKKLQSVFAEVQNDLTYTSSDNLVQNVSIAMILEGSLSKGKILNENDSKSADVDIINFYDKDELLEHTDDIIKAHPDGTYAQKYQLEMEKIADVAKRELANDKDNYFKHLAASRAIRAVFSEKINQKFQNNEIRRLQVLAIRKFDGQDSIYENITSRLAKGIDTEKRKKWGNNQEYHVSKYFHLDIGGGMKKYIRGFLNRLSLDPEEKREAVWLFVKNAIEKTERDGKTSDKLRHQFPSTYEEACKYYGVDIAVVN